jgi:two-component system cell cycle sensor histidine kinase/response regulator CckA
MIRGASGGSAHDVAHDLNNLLTAIIGAADAALERSVTDPEARADIAHIREGARRGAMLVRRLRGDTNDAACAPELIAVNDTIRATSRLLDHRLGADVALVLDLAEPNDKVKADPSQLDRTLLNLVVNASHAMPEGGTVTLSTARRIVAARELLSPDTVPPGDYVLITVADTGVGIPPDQISRIFTAGFSSRRNAGGSGLGLASVRDVVHQSNGYLSVASVEGRGARFDIYLPRVDDEAPPAVAETAQMATSRTVLLVEDDVLVRHVIERALRRAGWIVLSAGSAEQALEILTRSVCDLMISDIAMPGMDGVALARLVLARQPELPVILTSGYACPAADAEFRVANVVFLVKPYGHAELLGAVERIAQGRDAVP